MRSISKKQWLELSFIEEVPGVAMSILRQEGSLGRTPDGILVGI